MFEWHFTIRGPADSEFAGGVYHGKILLPPEYPFKPPNIVFCTPSGRFETNVKVCLSFSAHHPELWQPAWGIRLILEAIISFLPTPADGAIGALDWTKEERAKLAKESVKFHCPGMHHAKEEEEEDDVADSGGENKEEAKETEQGGSSSSIDETSQLLPSVTEDGADTCASESQETKPKPTEEANDNAKPAPLPDQNPPDQSSSEPSDVNPTLEQSTPDNATESPTTTNVTGVAAAGETSAGNQTSAAVAPPAINNQGNIPAASPQHSILVTEPFLNGMILAFSVT
eukprot:scaffold22676_cov85-Skeletonema_marinoi.AAC.1